MLESKDQNHRVTSNEADLENDSNSLETEGKQRGIGEDSSTITDGSSLLIGLGSGPRSTSNTRHQLLRAILLTMKQPAFAEILSAVTEIFTESTTFSRNAHAMRHQECFALKPNTDGMMDVLRKAFLANVDDIYKLADEYAETYGLPVSVKETTTRGYYLSIPTDMGTDIPDVFIQPVKRGRFIHCTTEEVRHHIQTHVAICLLELLSKLLLFLENVPAGP
jgi:DNA mismatch repair protein MSH4